MNLQSFIAHVNTLRKTDKNKWYFFVGEVEGKYIELKGYNTWLQIYRVDGVQYGNNGDRKVADYLKDLALPF